MKRNLVPLSSVAEIIAGQSPESKYYNTSGEGLPFFQGKADFNGTYPTVRFFTSKATKIALPNDILLSVRAPVGPTNICNVESCIGRGLAAIRPGKDLHFKYVYYFFKTIEERLAASGNGSTFSAITTGVVRDIQITLPPLPIQKKIAAILDKADSLRQKDRQLLEHYNKLAQSIFCDMFGDPVRNEKGWQTASLAQSSERIQIGPFGSLLHEADYVQNGIPLVNPRHIVAGRIIPDQKQTITKAKHESLAMYSLRKDDLIMGRRGEMGRCAIVSDSEEGWLCGTGSLFIRPGLNINSTFLYFVMSSQSIRTWLEHESIGTTLPNLNATIINKLSIPLPDINLQRRFELAIQKVSWAKTHCEEVATLSDRLFQDLLQKAFKGELVKEP